MAASNLACHADRLWQRIVGAAVRPRRSPRCATRLVSAPSKSTCPIMSDEAPVCEIHNDGENIFVFIDGVKIAKRGLLGTPQADTWIMLKPGWMVRDVKGGKAIQVSYEHAWMH